MSKRVLSCILVLVLVIGSATVAFAGNVPPAQQANYPGGASVQYVSVSSVDVNLNIVGSTAMANLRVIPKATKNVDRVGISVTLSRKGDITAIKKWDATIYPNAIGEYTWNDSHKLSAKGSYRLTATIKCYSGRTLVETVSENSANVAY